MIRNSLADCTYAMYILNPIPTSWIAVNDFLFMKKGFGFEVTSIAVNFLGLRLFLLLAVTGNAPLLTAFETLSLVAIQLVSTIFDDMAGFTTAEALLHFFCTNNAFSVSSTEPCKRVFLTINWKTAS